LHQRLRRCLRLHLRRCLAARHLLQPPHTLLYPPKLIDKIVQRREFLCTGTVGIQQPGDANRQNEDQEVFHRGLPLSIPHTCQHRRKKGAPQRPFFFG
jgi:hypothetical protein